MSNDGNIAANRPSLNLSYTAWDRIFILCQVPPLRCPSAHMVVPAHSALLDEHWTQLFMFASEALFLISLLYTTLRYLHRVSCIHSHCVFCPLLILQDLHSLLSQRHNDFPTLFSHRHNYEHAVPKASIQQPHRFITSHLFSSLTRQGGSSSDAAAQTYLNQALENRQLAEKAEPDLYDSFCLIFRAVHLIPIIDKNG